MSLNNSTRKANKYVINDSYGTYPFKNKQPKYVGYRFKDVEVQPKGTPVLGKKCTFEFDRNSGDLMTKMILSAKLGEVKYTGSEKDANHAAFAWADNIGNTMIEEVTLQIGNQIIDNRSGDYFNLIADLTMDKDQRQKYNRMIGNIPELNDVSRIGQNNIMKDEYNLFVPLMFYFHKDNGYAIPVMDLNVEHKIKLTVQFKPANQLYISNPDFQGTVDIQDVLLHVGFADLPHEVKNTIKGQNRHSEDTIIDRIKKQQESINKIDSRINLDFNTLVKELLFTVNNGNYYGGRFMIYGQDWKKARKNAAKRILLSQYNINEHGFFDTPDVNPELYEPVNLVSDPNVIYIINDPKLSSTLSSDKSKILKLKESVPLIRFDPKTNLKNNQGEKSIVGDLKNKVKGHIRIFVEPNTNRIYPIVEKITMNNLTMADLSVPVEKFTDDNRNEFIKKGDFVVWQHDNHGLYLDKSGNSVGDIEIVVGDTPLQTRRHSSWYDTVESHYNHPNNSKTGIHTHSFVINPDGRYPTGCYDFSNINNANLNLSYIPNEPRGYKGIFSNDKTTITVYAKCYCKFKIARGEPVVTTS